MAMPLSFLKDLSGKFFSKEGILLMSIVNGIIIKDSEEFQERINPLS